MQQVNVFIETSSRFRGNVERKCGYVLSTQLRTGKETREHFGRVTGTYHQAILLTMVDALDHMTRTCDVCFYISDLYVTSRLGKITEMAGSGWLDTKGKPIANREEWCRLFKAINQLPDPHEITAKTEKHSYSAWLREEMKHRECGRILGQVSLFLLQFFLCNILLSLFTFFSIVVFIPMQFYLVEIFSTL